MNNERADDNTETKVDHKVRAVFFDFGGVVTTSPFDAFASYEQANELPADLIRTINSTDPDDNAWAKFERRDVDVAGFVDLFESEARALGHELDGRAVLGLVAGTVRPEMVIAIDRIKSHGLLTACLTNNFRPHAQTRPDATVSEVMAKFDFVIESAVIGVRKPEALFYQRALEQAQVKPGEVIFLDDLGVNLKPARAMGMTTIKVVDPSDALNQLQAILGISLG